MFLRIQQTEKKLLVGKSLTMSLVQNRTGELWQSFMPERRLIKGATDHLLYSLQIYDADYFKRFNPANQFTKWAAVQVSSVKDVPPSMSSIEVPAGSYAVFLHKGPASEGAKTFSYIFQQWLPASGYTLDNRPHFELLGEKYKGNDPSSEEEFWIPVIV